MTAQLTRIDLPEPRSVDFSSLSRDRLEDMEAAGREVLDCHRVLAKTSHNIVGEVLRDQGKFYEWNHYPEGDLYDHITHAQFYYHAHPQELRGGEHGHFHTFLRPQGMPKGVQPALVPDLVLPEGENEALSHLIAISMDPSGVPIRLFTTNRWVTGEVWYAADDVRAMLDSFEIDLALPSWPVNRWIGAMVRLFRPQIGALIDARDGAVEAWTGAYPDRDVYEDRELELTSVMDIDTDAQIAAVSAALVA
ncbi:MAG: hypothetical protein V3R85_10065 [Alphaproteobacteria bacterium]